MKLMVVVNERDAARSRQTLASARLSSSVFITVCVTTGLSPRASRSWASKGETSGSGVLDGGAGADLLHFEGGAAVLAGGNGSAPHPPHALTSPGMFER